MSKSLLRIHCSLQAAGRGLLLMLLGLLAACNPAGRALAELPDDLPGAVAKTVEQSGLPAVCAAVISSDNIDLAVSGVRKLGSSEAATLDDYWHLGSNTKAISATMIGELVAQGKLSWDSTVDSAWPAFAVQIDPGYRGVTLRELLRHRAGLPGYDSPEDVRNMPDFTGSVVERRAAFARFVLSQPPGGKRGEYQYSNAGYAIAAALAESASGQSYEELMQQYIFAPMALQAAWGWPLKQGPAQPWGHTRQGFALAPHDPADGYKLEDYLAPAGDLSLRLGDYSKFVQAHLRGLRGLEPLGEGWEGFKAKAASPVELTAALVQELHVPDGDYSCGWLEQELMGQPSSAHEGSAGTFHAITAILPQSDLAVVVITNAVGDAEASRIRELALHLIQTRLKNAQQ